MNCLAFLPGARFVVALACITRQFKGAGLRPLPALGFSAGGAVHHVRFVLFFFLVPDWLWLCVFMFTIVLCAHCFICGSPCCVCRSGDVSEFVLLCVLGVNLFDYTD